MKTNVVVPVIAALFMLTGCGGGSDDLRLTGSFDNLVTNCGDGEILNEFPVDPPREADFLVSGEIKAGNTLTLFGDSNECGYTGVVKGDGTFTGRLPSECLREHIASETLFIADVLNRSTSLSLTTVSDTLGHCSAQYSGAFSKNSGSTPVPNP